MTPTLSSHEVSDALGTRCIGRTVRCHDAVASTNDLAFAWAADDAPEGAVVVADSQTRGRGRQRRAWASPRGGLWCSVVLRTALPAADRPFLTVVGAIALARAIDGLAGITTTIRWPNDVLYAGRKLAGVLVEVREGADGVVAVVGIGCNVDHVPSDLAADVAAHTTCVADAAGRPVDRLALLRALCQELDEAWSALGAGHTAALDDEWRRRSAVLGQQVRVTVGDAVAEGEVVAIGASDGVTLRLRDGAQRRYRSEHITRLELR